MPYDPEPTPGSNATQGSNGISRRGSLLAAAAAIATMASRGSTAAPARNQIIIGWTQEATSFHPLQPPLDADQGIHLNIFNPLSGSQPDGTFAPSLAVEVPTTANGGLSADGLKWRVKLRDDAKWHDGTKFTAEDVKFTLELLVDDRFLSVGRAGHNLVRDITIVSPTEITWRLEKPYASYPAILSWTFIVPKHILAGAPDPNSGPFFTAPVGTGPYKFAARVPGDSVTLQANPDYFGAKAKVPTLIFRYIPDQTVLYTQFRAGEVDYTSIVGIAPEKVAEGRKLPDRKILLGPRPAIEFFAFNLGRPVFQDKAVRQALYAAVDKTTILDAVYYNLRSASESYLPKENWGYNPNLPKQEYNLDKARKLLEDAGWRVGPDGVRVKNNIRLEFINSTTAGSPPREMVQQILQQAWASIGARMQIKNMPAAVVFGDYWSMSKYDTMIVGWNHLVGPDPDVTAHFGKLSIPAKGGAGENYTQYENPVVDELLAEGVANVDQDKRKVIYFKVQEIIREDLPVLPLYQSVSIEGAHAKLMGFRPNIHVRIPCWNMAEWYWDS